jgi:hypothetical protein
MLVFLLYNDVGFKLVSDMKKDLETLLSSWKKYTNKKDKKAQRLKSRIESEIAIYKLSKQLSESV